MRRAVMMGGILGTMLALPALSAAQMQSWHDVQVRDVETMKDKFIGLAEAFDESDYDWRPMEGVRSVREVLALAVAECNLFPTLWGHTPPDGTGQGFGGEMARVSAMSKAGIMGELEKSFDHLIGIVREMDENGRSGEADFFGQTVSVASSISMASADMHEHLGQLIAYARTNEVVPPWSRGDGMD